MEDFDSSTRYKLSHLLEPNRTPSYWPHLAAQLRIDRLLVDRLRGKDEPVINLFNSYECTTEDPSIPTIYDACIAIERYDTLKHFKKFQEVEVNIFFLFNHDIFCGDAVKESCFYDVAKFCLFVEFLVS